MSSALFVQVPGTNAVRETRVRKARVVGSPGSRKRHISPNQITQFFDKGNAHPTTSLW